MTDARHIAEEVRRQCLRAAIAAYEEAGISGLCAEGRWEMAVRAIEALDLGELLAELEPPGARR